MYLVVLFHAGVGLVGSVQLQLDPLAHPDVADALVPEHGKGLLDRLALWIGDARLEHHVDVRGERHDSTSLSPTRSPASNATTAPTQTKLAATTPADLDAARRELLRERSRRFAEVDAFLVLKVNRDRIAGTADHDHGDRGDQGVDRLRAVGRDYAVHEVGELELGEAPLTGETAMTLRPELVSVKPTSG